MKRVRYIVQVSRDIGTIRLHSMSSKPAKGDHLFVTL